LQKAGYYPKTGKTYPSGGNEDDVNFSRDMRENREKFIVHVSDVGRKKDL
jgi:hypothetical protein